MADRRVKVTFEANVGNYKKGMDEAASATEKLAESAEAAGKSSDKQKAALKTLAPAAMVAGAGLVAGVGMAVAKFASFDKAMSAVDAATHETAGNMALLREAAMTAGADTAFSAEEAAKGIEELAKAGVSTSDIMGGGLTGALSLAAAGELAVGDAAEIAATALVQFKLSGDQIPHLADLLAAGAGKAQGSVQDLGAALNQSGLVASATGLTIEETTGTLSAFASSGLLGSDAGTSFKSMLQALQNPSKKASLEMEALGINMYDANGEFAGMSNLAGQLQTGLSHLTQAERDKAMATIFGSDAVRAANVLYSQGAAGIDDWTNKVNDAGFAADTAARLQNNLAGDLEKLGGSFDTVFLKAGGVGNDGLRVLVQGLEGVVDTIGKIPGPVLGVGTVLAGVAGGALLLGGGLITAIPKIKETRDALRDLAPSGSKADKALRGAGKGAAVVGAAAGVATIGLVALTAAVAAHNAAQGDAKGSGAFAKDLADLTSGAKSAGDLFSNIDIGKVDGYLDTVDSLGAAFGRLNPRFGDIRGHLAGFGADVLGVNNDVAKVKAEFEGLDGALAAAVQSGNAEAAADGFAKIKKEAEAQGVPLEELTVLFPQYGDALAGVAAKGPEASAAAQETASALDEVGLAADGAIESMDKFLESLFALGNVNMSAREAAAAYQEALEGVTEAQKEIAKGKMGKTLNKTKDDFNLTTEAGKLAQAEFHGLAKGGMAEVEAMAAQGLGQDELQGKLNTTYKDLVKAGEGFGLSGKAAQELAREVLGVPDGVDIKTWMDSEAKRIAGETTGAIEAIPGYKKVEVVVSEDGTAGQVQSKVNEVTGKTEYILVSEDGTTAKVQAGIANIKGKDVPVWVDDNGTVYTTGGKIQGIKGKSVTIVADAETAAAEAALNNAARDRSSVISTRVVTTKVTHESTGVGGRGGLTRASGGSVFGQGTETSDSIPAWLSNNEHVLSAKEVRGLGGHSAVERLRAMARGGDAPRFATGGRVGWSQGQDAREKRQYEAAKRELAAAKKAAASAKKSKSKGDDKRAEQRLKRAEKELSAAKDEYNDSRERTKRLKESSFDLRRDNKRGSITEAFTSGNGMGVVDRMFEASNNTDLSKKQRGRLRSLAYKTESDLLRLEKRAASVERAMGKAVDKRDDLLSARNGARDSITGTFDMGSLLGQKDAYGYDKPVNKKGLLAYGKSLAAGSKTLSQKVKELQKRGFNEPMINQVIDEWTNGGTFELANAMLAMNKGERSSFNRSFKDLGTYGTRTGNSLTEAMAKGGLNAAQTLVNTIAKQEKSVDKAFYNLGKAGQKGFNRAWGIASPAKEAAKGAGFIVDGYVGGLDQNKSRLDSAMAGLMGAPSAPEMAFSVPPSAEVARFAAQPTSAGLVIDYDRLAQAMTNVQLNANLQIDRKQAGTLVQAGQKFNGNH